jgi:hypothetical protein
MSTADHRITAVGGHVTRDARRTATTVDMLMAAIQTPARSGGIPENCGYREATTPVIPTRIIEEYQIGKLSRTEGKTIPELCDGLADPFGFSRNNMPNVMMDMAVKTIIPEEGSWKITASHPDNARPDTNPMFIIAIRIPLSLR